MKKILLVLSIIVIVVLGFVFLKSSKPVIQSVDEKVMVEDYVRANIAKIATDKAVLGGTWYVVSINTNTVMHSGTVVYEDGHVQSKGTFSYNFDNTSGVVTINNFEIKTDYSDGGTVCTMDAKQCSDGSYVGRTGPKCEFICPPTSTSAKGTVAGRITLSPICPVERIPPDPQCAPKGYQTSVSARKDGQLVSTTTSNINGEYTFILTPGTYEISATGGQVLPRCSIETAVVKINSTITLNLSCDTGIR